MNAMYRFFFLPLLLCISLGCDAPTDSSRKRATSDREAHSRWTSPIRSENTQNTTAASDSLEKEPGSRQHEDARGTAELSEEERQKRIAASFPAYAAHAYSAIKTIQRKEEAKDVGFTAQWTVGTMSADVKKTSSILHPVVGELRVGLQGYTFLSGRGIVPALTKSSSGVLTVRFVPAGDSWTLVDARYVGQSKKGSVTPEFQREDPPEQLDEDYTEIVRNVLDKRVSAAEGS